MTAFMKKNLPALTMSEGFYNTLHHYFGLLELLGTSKGSFPLFPVDFTQRHALLDKGVMQSMNKYWVRDLLEEGLMETLSSLRMLVRESSTKEDKNISCLAPDFKCLNGKEVED